ncbi:hypothetical protein CSUI_007693 [Cystoisospora suis]|uniref:Uncharacterized protein n=1 Tax=Cystoisospora suis TaxID=483139 RepID=A0A2C6KPT3_9APIC|nr:hypothetical protein CSUI_007693 [Cystoisospora suis]
MYILSTQGGFLIYSYQRFYTSSVMSPLQLIKETPPPFLSSPPRLLTHPPITSLSSHTNLPFSLAPPFPLPCM